MAINNSVLVDETQAAQVIYTATGGLRGNAITTMYFCNRGATTTTFNLYVVPNGSVASANNIVYYNMTVAKGDTFVTDMEKLVLENGATLQANANVGDSIVSTISSIGVS
jgi:hypothetical protein